MAVEAAIAAGSLSGCTVQMLRGYLRAVELPLSGRRKTWLRECRCGLGGLVRCPGGTCACVSVEGRGERRGHWVVSK